VARATCALCGASNPVARVYLAFWNPSPNIISLSCNQCGETASQVRNRSEAVRFAVAYALTALPLVVLGLNVLGSTLDRVWILAIAATLPFTVLPAWWATRQADSLAQLAPAQELTTRAKISYLLTVVAVIKIIFGTGLLLYFVYID